MLQYLSGMFTHWTKGDKIKMKKYEIFLASASFETREPHRKRVSGGIRR